MNNNGVVATAKPTVSKRRISPQEKIGRQQVMIGILALLLAVVVPVGLYLCERTRSAQNGPALVDPLDDPIRSLGSSNSDLGNDQAMKAVIADLMKHRNDKAYAKNFHNCGVTLFDKGRFLDAASMFGHAGFLEPDNQEHFYDEANALEKEADRQHVPTQYHQAIVHWQAFVKRWPHRVDARANLANSLRKAHQYPASRAQYLAIMKSKDADDSTKMRASANLSGLLTQ